MISEDKVKAGKTISHHSFVRAEDGFKSVTVTAGIEIKLDGVKKIVAYSLFVEATEECFKKDEWMELALSVTSEDLLQLHIGGCRKECKVNSSGTIVRPTVLNMTAEGPSRWANILKGQCKPKGRSSATKEEILSCVEKNNEGTTSTTAQTATSTPASRGHTQPLSSFPVVPVVVGVVVGTVVLVGTVVVMAVCWRKRRKGSSAGGLCLFFVLIMITVKAYFASHICL